MQVLFVQNCSHPVNLQAMFELCVVKRKKLKNKYMYVRQVEQLCVSGLPRM